MFIREVVKNNKDGSKRQYLQITKSIRIGKKVKQVVLCSLGRVDNLTDSGQLDKMMEKLSTYSKIYQLQKMDENIFNENVIYHGAIAIFNKLWKDIGLKNILSKLISHANDEINYTKAIEQMVLNRLIHPTSKRGLSFESQKICMPNEIRFDTNAFYRSMDRLFPYIEKIEDKIFNLRPTDLFSGKLDVVFFDTTSVKFYGENPKSLMKYGHSKEKRSDLCQMVVGLLIDTSGIPVAHKIFPGNTTDVKTVIPIVEEFRKRFNLGKIIFTGDSGMMSEHNLEMLENLGWEYIIACRIKTEKYIKEVVLESMKRTCDIKEIESYAHYTLIEETLLIKEILNEKTKRRYILCYNPIEGWSEFDRRIQMITKLKKYQGKDTKELVNNKGYKSYIKSGLSKIFVDEPKAISDIKYDGRYVLKTNSDIPKEEIVNYYKTLIRVEQCFHELKGEVLIAPVYHWTEERVKAHVFICYLALLVWQVYAERVKSYDGKLSVSDVWREICNLMSSVIRIGNKRMLVRMEPSELALTGFKACNANLPRRLEVLDK